MPFFEKSDFNQEEKMKIIRRHVSEIKAALEEMLKKRKNQLLDDGYTESQADSEIEEMRDQLSKEAIIFFNKKMKAATSVQDKFNYSR